MFRENDGGMYIGDFRIHRVINAAQRRAFVEFPYELYKNDPDWRPPLRIERLEHQNPDKNPALKHVEKCRFLATRNGKTIGRIAAIINHPHRRKYEDDAGHFGFFDCVGEAEVGAGLLEVVEKRLRDKGCLKIIGPTDWTVNDQCGLLVDGFGAPNVVMMNHGRPYYQAIIEAAGYKKAVDMYAYYASLAGPYLSVGKKMKTWAENDPSINYRPLDMRRLHPEFHIAMDIFNDAWSENWGFIPFSPEEVDHMIKEMRPVLKPDQFLFGLIDSVPVAFVCVIPDINEAVRDLDGKLFPTGWAKLLYRLKANKINQCRVPLMGIRKRYHNSRRGVATVAHISHLAFEAARTGSRHTHIELSWILETNKGMIGIAEQMSAKRYKTYRMYEKGLT